MEFYLFLSKKKKDGVFIMGTNFTGLCMAAEKYIPSMNLSYFSGFYFWYIWMWLQYMPPGYGLNT